MFKSQKMSLYCLLMPREGAWQVLNELGHLSLVHFVDSDPEIPLFNRPFYKQIKRCDDSLYKLQWIEEEMYKFATFCESSVEFDLCNNVDTLIQYLKNDAKQKNIPEQTYYSSIENQINQKQLYLEQLLSNFNNVINHRNILIQQRIVLKEAHQITYDKLINNQINFPEKIQITFLAGIINSVDEYRFSKAMFRASKGNIWSHYRKVDISMQKQGFKLINQKQLSVDEQKTIFIIIYGCGLNSHLDIKLRKLCQSFNANIFSINTNNIGSELNSIEIQIEESNKTIRISQNVIYDYFEYFQQNNGICSNIEYFRLAIMKEKSIQINLNYLINNGTSFYKGLIWIKESEELNIIKTFHQKSGLISSVQFHKLINYSILPPTKFNTNDFLVPFQEIVNTYGIPKYREINPSFFAVVTFPFMFGIMFGDIGHGAILFVFGLILIFNTNKNSFLYQLRPARYILTMMGFFAFYNGIIYNDFMSIPMNLFQSCYSENNKLLTKKTNEECTYIIGIDPIWGLAENKLQIENSLKMKTSVIFGICQMLLGVFLKGLNSIEQISFLDFFFEFIPQLVFLTSTFGYMVFMIILKWNTNYTSDTSQAPSILNYMLNLALDAGGLGQQKELYLHQSADQIFLLSAALISVPLMLFPKPIIKYYQHKQKHKIQEDYQQLQNIVQMDSAQKFLESNFKLEMDEKNHDFSEEFVHQIIETIEFVLGSISHTASYLRLWALSLAHSQLADVFFEKTLKQSIENGSSIGIIIGFSVFAVVTFGVLICMDAMECFLHTLRLHWVEFQSKFYKAEGYLFVPFCFKSILLQEKKK